MLSAARPATLKKCIETPKHLSWDVKFNVRMGSGQSQICDVDAGPHATMQQLKVPRRKTL
jgi:hypothetical protein